GAIVPCRRQDFLLPRAALLGYSFRGDGDPHPADYLPLLWWFQLPAIPAPVGYGLSAQLCRRFAVALQRLPNPFSRPLHATLQLDLCPLPNLRQSQPAAHFRRSRARCNVLLWAHPGFSRAALRVMPP